MYRWHHLPEQRAGTLYCSLLWNLWASLVAQMVKNPPAMKETWVPSLVGKIPWRMSWEPAPVFFPGESPWIEKPGGLQSLELLRVRHKWVRCRHTHICACTRAHTHTSTRTLLGKAKSFVSDPEVLCLLSALTQMYQANLLACKKGKTSDSS